jgi:ketosteroid isomerase-like protein
MGVPVAASGEFEQAMEASHRALDLIARGDPNGFFDLYTERDDATLANPFGPPVRGRSAVEEVGRRAAANYRDGRAVGFENLATFVGGELAYMLEIERFETKLAGGDALNEVALRVTSIFRREEGVWRLVHRHADPITVPRPPASVIQQ